jgi:hypothetical protein
VGAHPESKGDAMRYPHDDERDAENEEWAAALATGDHDIIEQARDRLLIKVHTRIMNDDPNYVEAGWTP